MSVFTIGISIIVCIITAFYFFQWKKNYNKLVHTLSKLPNPKGWFLFGNVDELGASTDTVFGITIELSKKYGGLYCLWLLFTPIVTISKGKYMEKIITSTVEIEKSTFYNFLRPWLGTGLLTSTGRKWQSHRKMFTPTFHFAMLDSFIDTFIDKSDKLIQNLKQIPSGTVFDVYPLVSLLTLDIISSTAMGVDLNIQLNKKDNECEGYISSHTILNKALIEQMFKPWLWSNFIFDRFNSLGRQRVQSIKKLHEFTLKVISERRNARQNYKQISGLKQDEDLGIKKKKAFLDILLDASEEGSNLTDDDIREEVDTFMFEGNDTTSNALAWALLLLGNHPDVQDKVFEELDTIFQGTDRRIEPADVADMKYLERVIKETLRLFPSVPRIGRILRNDFHLEEFIIPAGTNLNIDIGTMQRDPDIFENPNMFNPDHFLPEKVKSRNTFSYLAFSAGPRNCIGQKFALNQIKVVLATVIRNFRIESVHKTEEITPLLEMTFRPKGGVKLRLYSRSNQQ